MAKAQEHRIKLVLTGDAEKGFKVLTTETKKARKELKKLEKGADKIGSSLRKMHDSLIVGKELFGKMSGTIQKVRQSYIEMQRVQKRMTFGLESMGLSADKAKRKVTELNLAFEDSARKTLFGVEEQSRAVDVILRTTGDLEEAMGLLDLAMDGATRTGKDLSDASKGLAEAFTGDLGPLKEMGLLTGEQIKHFNTITDSTVRWQRALEHLKPKLDGARDSIDETTKSSKRLEADADKLLGAFGKLTVNIGEATAAIAGFGTETSKGQTAIGDFADKLTIASDNLLTYAKNATIAEMASDWVHEHAKMHPLGRVAQWTGLWDPDSAIEERLKKIMAMRRKQAKTPTKAPGAGGFLTFGPEWPGPDPEDIKKKGPSLTEQLLALAPKGPSRKGEISDIFGAEFEEPRQREERARKELEILRETNEAERVRLDLKMQLADIDQQDLSTMEKRLEIEKALQEAKSKMDAIDTKASENSKKSSEKAANRRKAQSEALKLAQQQQNAAVMAGVSGAITLADTVIESDRAVAGLKALFETAQAAAAYPDPVGMIQHGVAAAQFAAIAGGAGGVGV